MDNFLPQLLPSIVSVVTSDLIVWDEVQQQVPYFESKFYSMQTHASVYRSYKLFPAVNYT